MKYDEMSVQSLRAECKKLGITTVPRRKAELIELLTRSQSSSSEAAPRGDGHTGSSGEGRAVSDMSRDSRVSECMSEEEKVAARRKRFGVPAGHASASRESAGAAESTPEDERIKIEQRRRRFCTKGD